jgi:Fe-S cluster biosynthesis and repair protein YggX
MVQCKKLGRELPGLSYRPFQNALGERVFNEISEEAWKLWLNHAKMIINEYRLNLADIPTQNKLLVECERFLFSEESALPPDFVPSTPQSH